MTPAFFFKKNFFYFMWITVQRKKFFSLVLVGVLEWLRWCGLFLLRDAYCTNLGYTKLYEGFLTTRLCILEDDDVAQEAL